MKTYFSKLATLFRLLESDFVSLSPSPPAGAVRRQRSGEERQFSFEFSDALLTSLLQFQKKKKKSHIPTVGSISSTRNKIFNLRGPFAKFVDSPHYSKSEHRGGAVTVSFSKYFPWQTMHFLQRSTHF
jgi:hypothetical protein